MNRFLEQGFEACRLAFLTVRSVRRRELVHHSVEVSLRAVMLGRVALGREDHQRTPAALDGRFEAPAAAAMVALDFKGVSEIVLCVAQSAGARSRGTSAMAPNSVSRYSELSSHGEYIHQRDTARLKAYIPSIQITLYCGAVVLQVDVAGAGLGAVKHQ